MLQIALAYMHAALSGVHLQQVLAAACCCSRFHEYFISGEMQAEEGDNEFGWGSWGRRGAELRDLVLISGLHPLSHSTCEPVAAIFIFVLAAADGPSS